MAERTGAPFNHACTAAIRHALTVGFIWQMIVGVSLMVVPGLRPSGTTAAMTALHDYPAAALWAIWLLLNGGGALRVAGQTPRAPKPGWA